jgi:hypothetical protein
VADIKAQLKGLAPPYAAYALLRSAREWRRFSTGGGIALPAHIREILEATYAPWPDEPETWQLLRQELERRAEKLRSKAVGTTNAWALPALADDEGVQTRYSDYPTATLVLLQLLERTRGKVRLTTLEGTSVIAHERDWSRDVAVALHRNHLKIPVWWLHGCEPDNPAPLRPYFVGRWALATVDGENARLNGDAGDSAGLKYLADRGVWREPAPGRLPSPDYEDDFWRQLAAITTLRSAGNLGGPLALRNVLDTDAFDLWVGALVTHPMQIAKLVDTVESVFHHVPVALTQETGHLIYSEGVAYAERIAGCLGRAVANYRRRLKDEIERGEGRKRGLNLKARASLHYWTAAEHVVSELFRLVSHPPPVEKARYQFARTMWGKELFRAALGAYELACPHDTPRLLQAYVLGRAEFFRSSPETEPNQEPEEQTA